LGTGSLKHHSIKQLTSSPHTIFENKNCIYNYQLYTFFLAGCNSASVVKCTDTTMAESRDLKRGKFVPKKAL